VLYVRTYSGCTAVLQVAVLAPKIYHSLGFKTDGGLGHGDQTLGSLVLRQYCWRWIGLEAVRSHNSEYYLLFPEIYYETELLSVPHTRKRASQPWIIERLDVLVPRTEFQAHGEWP